MRLFFLIPLLLAALLAWNKLSQPSEWPQFQKNQTSNDSARLSGTTTTHSRINPELSPVDSFLPDTFRPSVHAASVIPLKNGRWRSFWFAGSREGASDVVILSSVWDKNKNVWQPPTVVLDRKTAQNLLGRYIAKLGNPVPFVNKNGQIELFVVTVSVGGWAGSSITRLNSDDEGETWSKPRRLITSPFINISTLVKSPGFFFSDGTIGLPVYHEWIGKYGELLRLDHSGKVIDKRRLSSGRGTLQPVIFFDNENQAQVFFRQARKKGPNLIPVSQSQNAGLTWQVKDDLNIPNPNSAIAGIELSNGARLMAINDLEHGRKRLVMLASFPSKTNPIGERSNNYSNWKILKVLDDETQSNTNSYHEFSYPYLSANEQGDVMLLYTWNRKKIKTVIFENNNLNSALSTIENSDKFQIKQGS